MQMQLLHLQNLQNYLANLHPVLLQELYARRELVAVVQILEALSVFRDTALQFLLAGRLRKQRALGQTSLRHP